MREAIHDEEPIATLTCERSVTSHAKLDNITPDCWLSSMTSADGSDAYARTGANEGTRNAFLIIAMTLFAVVVLHGEYLRAAHARTT